MPQHGHKKPFSAKQKKKQLQQKRERKKTGESGMTTVPGADPGGAPGARAPPDHQK